VTGKPVTGEHVLEIWQPNAEGKLLHAWSYSNPTEALKQVGAVEKTPETPAAGRHTP
jgi:protocatechuate 3,4-dioxygenase beta subunit